MRKKMKIELHMRNKYSKQDMKHDHKNINFIKKIRKKILYIFHIESSQIDRKSYKLWRIPLFHKNEIFEQVLLIFFRQP